MKVDQKRRLRTTRDPKKRRVKRRVTRKKYKRGALIKAIYDYFDEVGFDNIEYDEAKKIARIKPDTKFNKYHFAWYKNDYKNRRDIP